jgi:hypothetical protein
MITTDSIVTEFERFEGTVVAGSSQKMRFIVKKDGGEFIRVTLIPLLEMPDELLDEMEDLTSSKFRCLYLEGIKGAKEQRINRPYKICLLHAKRVRVAPDGIDVLDAITSF